MEGGYFQNLLQEIFPGCAALAEKGHVQDRKIFLYHTKSFQLLQICGFGNPIGGRVLQNLHGIPLCHHEQLEILNEKLVADILTPRHHFHNTSPRSWYGNIIIGNEEPGYGITAKNAKKQTARIYQFQNNLFALMGSFIGDYFLQLSCWHFVA